jgi:hypothetical protein
MTKAQETILFLARFNFWRRSNDNAAAPSPTEVGAAIDDAVNLLIRYDEMERVRYALEDSLTRSQQDADQQCRLKETFINKWETSEQKVDRLQKRVDAMKAAIDQFCDAARKEQE